VPCNRKKETNILHTKHFKSWFCRPKYFTMVCLYRANFL